MIGSILLEVFGRTFFSHSFSWSEELARFSFIWLTFIGASAVYKNNEMVGFDLLSDKLQMTNKRILFIVVQLFISIFLIVLIYYGFNQTFSRSVMYQKSAGLGLHMWIPYISIPIGMLFMFIHVAAKFVMTVTRKEVV